MAAKTRPRPERKKRKNNMSPEARQKLSELARQRHAEGKLGGPEFGKLGGRGNTREKRLASMTVAEAAQDNAEAIISVFKDAIDPDRPMGQRLKGAELWLTVERESKKMAMAQERADTEKLDRQQLIDILKKNLATGPTANIVRGMLEEENIIDAEVVEEPDGNH